MEHELIARAQQGDTLAFRELVEAYSGLAWRTARVLLRDSARAEDATQEAWLDVWQNLHRFELGRPFRSWLLTLLANRCRMIARRHTPTVTPLTQDDEDLLIGTDTTSEPALQRETGDELRAVLAALPPDQQHVLELRYFADLDLAEIASLTGVPLGTVKSRLHRSLYAVRARLQHNYDLISNGGL
ncbi:MAG TPA: sigma-70 family RNA polymerase sigma factor [Ktedonobacterales bacterium]